MIIVSVIYAELQNKKYVYTPFKKMQHNYNNEPEFLEKKEWLINFLHNFELNQHNAMKISHGELITFFDSNLAACSNSFALKKIKRIFRSNKNVTEYFNHDHFNIAIHIRRSNPCDIRTGGTDTPDNLYLDIINKLRIVYSAKKPLFHIYSQSFNKENFELFNAQDIVLHINEPLESTYIEMILADALVTGTSSFSYTAAILSDGIIYYVPFWHPPLPHWISIHTLII